MKKFASCQIKVCTSGWYSPSGPVPERSSSGSEAADWATWARWFSLGMQSPADVPTAYISAAHSAGCAVTTSWVSQTHQSKKAWTNREQLAQMAFLHIKNIHAQIKMMCSTMMPNRPFGLITPPPTCVLVEARCWWAYGRAPVPAW